MSKIIKDGGAEVVYSLPADQIRKLRELAPELIEQIQKALNAGNRESAKRLKAEYRKLVHEMTSQELKEDDLERILGELNQDLPSN